LGAACLALLRAALARALRLFVPLFFTRRSLPRLWPAQGEQEIKKDKMT
jgi:hypothetical protein